jgi:hypothetical protein
MTGAKWRGTLLFAAMAAAGLLSRQAAQAQETRGMSRGGTSSWGAGTAAAGASAPKAGSSTGSASWTAGKASFGSNRQADGVWRDGSTTSITTEKSLAKSIASGMPATGEALKTPGVFTRAEGSAAAPSGHSRATQGKALASRSSTGLHASGHAQFGMARGGRGGAPKFTMTRSTASSSGGHATPAKKTGTKSGLGSAAKSAPGLNPLAGHSASGMPGLGAPTGLGEPIRLGEPLH